MKIGNQEFLVGADPEFFVKKKGSDAPISAHGLVPGDKKHPHKVLNGAVQVDGMALEFNIDPAKGPKTFVKNINSVMKQIMAMTPGLDVYEGCVAEFGAKYIEGQPEEAKMLGCEPDYNAYTGDINPRPDAKTPFRTAAGHVHVGWTKDIDPHHPDHFEACKTLTKQLDVHLALPSLLWDGEKKRRDLYGKLGCFRPTSYGMEYRVLSNAWLKRDIFMHTVYGNTMVAVKRLLGGKHDYDDMVHDLEGVFERGDLGEISYLFEDESLLTPKHYRGMVV